MANYILLLFIFSLSISNTLTQETVLPSTTTNPNAKDDNKSVEFCTTSTLHRGNYTIDYSWTIQNFHSYFLNERASNSSAPTQIHLSGLRFYEEILEGTWTIILTEAEHTGSVITSMLYEPPSQDPTHLTVTAELWLSFPWAEEPLRIGTVYEELIGTKFTPKIHTSILRGPIGILHHEKMGTQSRLLELSWHDRNYVQQIVEQFRENSVQNKLNGTEESLNKDELSFIFHLEIAVKNSPLDGRVNTTCSLRNIQALSQELREKEAELESSTESGTTELSRPVP